MSLITDMLIFICHEEREAMERLQAWCVEHDPDRQQRFEKLDTDPAGGSKWFTAEVWAMAGNYFRWSELIEAFPSFGWRDPESVVLIVDHESNDHIRVIRPADPELTDG